MVKILQFVNGKAARVVKSSGYKSSINYRGNDGVIKTIPVSIIFTTFNDGTSGAVLVATDREVTYQELLAAHERLIMKKRRVKIKPAELGEKKSFTAQS